MSERRGPLRQYWSGLDAPARGGLRVMRPVAGGAVRTFWQVGVHGAHHVPTSGPVILASNHAGFLDGPLLCGVVRRPVHALVKQEMFRGAVGAALRRLGQIPVDRFAVDVRAVRACLAVLDRGDALAIYPEGRRGAADFATMKPGVAYLALCTGAPVVPVACLGTRPDGGHIGSLPRLWSRVEVMFGPPTALPATEWPRRQGVVRDEARLLQAWLAEHVRYACELTGRRLPVPAPKVGSGLRPYGGGAGGALAPDGMPAGGTGAEGVSTGGAIAEPGRELDVEDIS